MLTFYLETEQILGTRIAASAVILVSAAAVAESESVGAVVTTAAGHSRPWPDQCRGACVCLFDLPPKNKSYVHQYFVCFAV